MSELSEYGQVVDFERPWLGGLEERLLKRRHVTDDGCWLWTGTRIPAGYGTTSYRTRKKYYVHRLAAHLWLGLDLDSRICVLHRCDNPPCFNPDHLFLGTQSDNLRDSISKGRFRYVVHRGEQNSRALVTESEVKRIRQLADKGLTTAGVARQFGLSWSQTDRIIERESWKHVA